MTTDFAARVECDSISEVGRRLISVVATYPRMIHSEVMTHRAFARNSASSRAIPFPRMLEMVEKHPFIPLKWGAEQGGMQTGDVLVGYDAEMCHYRWLCARDSAVLHAKILHKFGLHKSICNRVLEPYMWITVIITATEWENFFRLRCHPHAEIHLQKIATMIHDAISASEPRELKMGEWHLPFIRQDDREEAGDCLRAISTARAARLSYLTHDGVRSHEKDIELFDKLMDGSGFGHFSPHEHVATPFEAPFARSGPFIGWDQFRKQFANENKPTGLNYVPTPLTYRPEI